jgi:hypothetical protein
MSDPVDLGQRRAPLAEAAEDRLIAWRSHVDVMFQCSAQRVGSRRKGSSLIAPDQKPQPTLKTPFRGGSCGIVRATVPPICSWVESDRSRRKSIHGEHRELSESGYGQT